MTEKKTASFAPNLVEQVENLRNFVPEYKKLSFNGIVRDLVEMGVKNWSDKSTR